MRCQHDTNFLPSIYFLIDIFSIMQDNRLLLFEIHGTEVHTNQSVKKKKRSEINNGHVRFWIFFFREVIFKSFVLVFHEFRLIS